LDAGGTRIRIGGTTKGAGMIEPNMATMLGFLSTDADVTPAALQSCLGAAVSESFNRISVDGDQSTNDTVLMLANGAAGGRTLDEKDPDWDGFASAVQEVATRLAMKIVRDGEGATRFVTVTVRGAMSTDDARKATRAIANSLLVKTSWYGGDPNWGRVMDAVGYSGAAMREEDVEIFYDDLCSVRNGLANPEVAESQLAAILAGKEFTVTVDLHAGDADDTVYTCDCSEEYVKINSEYMT
ncbi:MAG: bifunctional ornithine acetyltransferase/N-acetylglutamate synthase, partial [Lentisphaerae bacterium]|nr:bifunctional ornithine acetyltransferase/N-acetylglutamate synthase [Lentisphaerota bacterium]